MRIGGLQETMERLTEYDEFGNADIIALADVMPKLYGELFFQEANALTDALNRLAEYEDTGFTPEEINNLHRKQESEPLTLDELREMDGQPVWIVNVADINCFQGHWDICDWENGERVLFPYCLETPDIADYDPEGKLGVAGWRAYRRQGGGDAK